MDGVPGQSCSGVSLPSRDKTKDKAPDFFPAGQKRSGSDHSCVQSGM